MLENPAVLKDIRLAGISALAQLGPNITSSNHF
jgi:hypothetical protein